MPKDSINNKLINALCFQNALDLIDFDSDNEEEDEDIMTSFHVNLILLLSHRRSTHCHVPKSFHWSDKVLKNLDDDIKRHMLRVDAKEFLYILELIKDDPVFKNKNSVPQLRVELQLQIALFRLCSYGEGASVRKIASLFGVGDGGTLQIITRRVFKAIIRLKQKYLFWPSEAERRNIVENTLSELPGCIGYIDGTEVRLAEAPTMHHEQFFSKKMQYAIKMQVICDHNLRIRQVTIGHRGSVHDAKMYRECPIARFPEKYFSNLQWIAGDSAYPLGPNLVTPFRQNSNELSEEARCRFNKYLSRYRARVQNCFEKLKEKFGSLRELKCRLKNEEDHKECCRWVLVCCILHNILQDFNFPLPSTKRDAVSNFPQEIIENGNLRHGLVNFINNRRID